MSPVNRDTANYIKHKAVVMYHDGQHLEALFKVGKKEQRKTFFNPDEIPLTVFHRGEVYWLWSVKPVV